MDECDAVGVWPIDEDAMGFYVGAPVSLDQFLGAVNQDKLRIIKRVNKLLVVGFIEFQYGELNDKCKPHQSYIKLIQKHGFFIPLPKGKVRVLEKEKETDKEKEMEKEKEEGGSGGDLNPPKPAPSIAGLPECVAAYGAALQHFKIQREPSESERLEIGRFLLRGIDAKTICLAFLGATKQSSSVKYNPAEFVSVGAYLRPDSIGRYVNLGAGAAMAHGTGNTQESIAKRIVADLDQMQKAKQK